MEFLSLLIEVFLELGLLFGGEFSGNLLIRFSQVSSPQEKRAWNSILASCGFLLLGALMGGLSAWAFPNPFVRSKNLQAINLFVLPLVAGAVMSFIGGFLRKRDRRTIRLESFAYGFLFALAFCLVRFIKAQAGR